MRTLFLVLKCLFRFFSAKKGDPFYWAGRDLLRKSSYRLPEGASRDTLIGLRVFKRTLMRDGAQGRSFSKEEGDRGVALFDGFFSSSDEKIAYVEDQSGERPDLAFFKNGALLPADAISQWSIPLMSFLAFLIVFPMTLFSSYKKNWALLIREIPEIHHLASRVKKEGIRKVYFFFIHEKDANATFLRMRQLGVEAIKIPNGNPLMAFNRVLITDRLRLTLPYQREELDAFEESFFYEEVKEWPPFEVRSYQNLYLTRENEKGVSRYELGFFSHGVMAREKEGHMIPEHGDLAAEKSMLPMLAGYLKDRPDLRLKIFLHPKEKADERTFADMRAAYEELFGKERIHFAEPDLPSVKGFCNVDLGIGGFSSILFERLYFGFKTLIVPVGMDFPLPNSSMRNACAFDGKELSSKIDRALEMSDRSFFEENDLVRYTCKDILTDDPWGSFS